MPRPLRGAVAVLAAMALLIASACSGGGGGGDGPDVTQGLGARQILTRSADALADAGPYRIALDGRLAAGDLAPSALLAGTVDLDGEGSVVPEEGFSLDLSVDAGLPVQVGLTRTEEGLFVSVLGSDLQVQAADDQIAALDPGRLVAAIPGLVQDPRIAGREEVDGTETVRIEGGIDSARAEAGLRGALGLLGDEESAAAARALREGRVAVLVGVEDLLPRRVELALGDPDGAPPSLEVRLDPSDFGADLEVRAPTGARPLTPDALGGLLGG